MKLEIESIGFIKHAEIDLQGMHVITGRPDMALRQLSSILGTTLEALWRYGEWAENDQRIKDELQRELTRRWGNIPPKNGEPEGRIVVRHQGELLMEAVAAQSRISVRHPQKLPFPLLYAFSSALNIYYWAEDSKKMVRDFEVMLRVEDIGETPEERSKSVKELALAAKILRFVFVVCACPNTVKEFKKQAGRLKAPLYLGVLEDGVLRYPDQLKR